MPLEMSVLTRTDTDEFEQLKGLLENFTIEVFIKNNPKYCENKDIDILVEQAIQEFAGEKAQFLLSNKDIKDLRKEIKSQIASAEKWINGGQDETRYYILKDGKHVVGFQQAQISPDKNGIICGWRPLAYTTPDHRITESKGAGRFMYEEVSKWFQEKGVEYEKTTTGVNMLRNIRRYIKVLGFLPYDKGSNTIYLKKVYEHKIAYSLLRKVYDTYESNRNRISGKSREAILKEIEDDPDFATLTEEQREGLIECFLKEEEKGRKRKKLIVSPKQIGKATSGVSIKLKNQTKRFEEEQITRTNERGEEIDGN